MANEANIGVSVKGDFAPILAQIRQIEGNPINLRFNSQPLGRITAQVSEFDKSLNAANARVIAFGASAGIISSVSLALGNMARESINVQKQLIDINTLLKTSDSSLNAFGNSLFEIAKDTGSSFNKVAEAAKELSRQGLGVQETLSRTASTMLLVRTSGLDAAQAVQVLTGAVNTFSKEGLSMNDVVQRLASVEQNFQVNSADLATALTHVGATAAEAKVSFNELVATITAVQQTTARGTGVISEGLRTIFTRLQRGGTLEQLSDLGIAVKDVQGKTLPAIQIITQLAQTFDSLGDAQKEAVGELAGGVRQMNTLKTALRDINGEYSVYQNALRTISGATDEATSRNEALNKSLSNVANQALQNFQKLSAASGKLVFGPSLERIFGGINDVAEKFDGESIGTSVGTAVLKGIGNALSGPGIVLGGILAARLLGNFAKFAAESAQKVLGIGQASEEQRRIQEGINTLLERNPRLYEQIILKSKDTVEQQQLFLKAVQDGNEALATRKNLVGSLGIHFAATEGDNAVRYNPEKKEWTVPKSANTPEPQFAGYVPNLVSPSSIAAEMSGARKQGYTISPSDVKEMNARINGRQTRVVYNNRETVIPNFAGSGEPAIIPPNETISDLIEKKSMRASGYVPNLADPNVIKRVLSQAAKLPNATNVIAKLGEATGLSNDKFTYAASKLGVSVGGDMSDNEYQNISFIQGLFKHKFSDLGDIGTGVVGKELVQNRENATDSKYNLPHILGYKHEDFLQTFAKRYVNRKGNVAFGSAGVDLGFESHMPTVDMDSGKEGNLEKFFGKRFAKYRQTGKFSADGYVPNLARGDFDELEPLTNVLSQSDINPYAKRAMERIKRGEGSGFPIVPLPKVGVVTTGGLGGLPGYIENPILPMDLRFLSKATEGNSKLHAFIKEAGLRRREGDPETGPRTGAPYFMHETPFSVQPAFGVGLKGDYGFGGAEGERFQADFARVYGTKAAPATENVNYKLGEEHPHDINKFGVGAFRAQSGLQFPSSVDRFELKGHIYEMNANKTNTVQTGQTLAVLGVNALQAHFGEMIQHLVEPNRLKSLLKKETVSGSGETYADYFKKTYGFDSEKMGESPYVMDKGNKPYVEGDTYSGGYVPNLVQMNAQDALNSRLVRKIPGLKDAIMRETTGTGVSLSQAKVNFLKNAGVPSVSVTNTRDEGSSADPMVGFNRVRSRGGRIDLAGSGCEYAGGYVPNLAGNEDVLNDALKKLKAYEDYVNNTLMPPDEQAIAQENLKRRKEQVENLRAQISSTPQASAPIVTNVSPVGTAVTAQPATAASSVSNIQNPESAINAVKKFIKEAPAGITADAKKQLDAQLIKLQQEQVQYEEQQLKLILERVSNQEKLSKQDVQLLNKLSAQENASQDQINENKAKNAKDVELQKRQQKNQQYGFFAAFGVPLIGGAVSQELETRGHSQEARGVAGVTSAIGTGISLGATIGGPWGAALGLLAGSALSLKSVFENLRPSIEDVTKRNSEFAAKQTEATASARGFLQAQANLREVVIGNGSNSEIFKAKQNQTEALNNITSPDLRRELLRNVSNPDKQNEIVARQEAEDARQQALNRINEDTTAGYARTHSWYSFGGKTKTNEDGSIFQDDLLGSKLSTNPTTRVAQQSVNSIVSNLLKAQVGKDISGSELDKIQKFAPYEGTNVTLRKLGLGTEQAHAIEESQTAEQANAIIQKFIGSLREIGELKDSQKTIEAISFSMKRFNTVLLEASSASSQISTIKAGRASGELSVGLSGIENANRINSQFLSSGGQAEAAYQIQQKQIEAKSLTGGINLQKEAQQQIASLFSAKPSELSLGGGYDTEKKLDDIVSSALGGKNEGALEGGDSVKLLAKAVETLASLKDKSAEAYQLYNQALQVQTEISNKNSTLIQEAQDANAINKNTRDANITKGQLEQLLSRLSPKLLEAGGTSSPISLSGATQGFQTTYQLNNAYQAQQIRLGANAAGGGYAYGRSVYLQQKSQALQGQFATEARGAADSLGKGFIASDEDIERAKLIYGAHSPEVDSLTQGHNAGKAKFSRGVAASRQQEIQQELVGSTEAILNTVKPAFKFGGATLSGERERRIKAAANNGDISTVDREIAAIGRQLPQTSGGPQAITDFRSSLSALRLQQKVATTDAGIEADTVFKGKKGVVSGAESEDLFTKGIKDASEAAKISLDHFNINLNTTDKPLKDLADNLTKYTTEIGDAYKHLKDIGGTQTATTLSNGVSINTGNGLPNEVEVPSGQTEVEQHAGGYIPRVALEQERRAIRHGIGGAKSTDRPIMRNIQGLGLSVINSGETVVNNWSPGKAAILNRNMKSAMGYADGYTPSPDAGLISYIQGKLSDKGIVVNAQEISQIINGENIGGFQLSKGAVNDLSEQYRTSRNAYHNSILGFGQNGDAFQDTLVQGLRNGQNLLGDANLSKSEFTQQISTGGVSNRIAQIKGFRDANQYNAWKSGGSLINGSHVSDSSEYVQPPSILNDTPAYVKPSSIRDETDAPTPYIQPSSIFADGYLPMVSNYAQGFDDSAMVKHLANIHGAIKDLSALQAQNGDGVNATGSFNVDAKVRVEGTHSSHAGIASDIAAALQEQLTRVHAQIRSISKQTGVVLPPIHATTG